MKRSLHAALPSIDALIVFEHAAQFLSFTKAGAQLGLTQSAVSRQVIDLEGLLQVQLFARERQRVRLTSAGGEFRELIRPVVQDLRAATLRMQMRSVQSNVLNVSIAASFCNLWFIPNLAGYSAETNAAQVNVMPHVGLVNFELSSIDAAIVNSELPPANCECVKLCGISVAPFAAASLLRRHGVGRLEDFQSIPAIELREIGAWWPRYLAAAELRTPIEFVGSHSLFLLNFEIALAGLGVALLPPEFVPSSGLGTLTRLHPLQMPVERSYYFCWPLQSSKREAVQSLGHWLQRELAEARTRGSRSKP